MSSSDPRDSVSVFGMRFDPTLNLGHLLTLVSLVIAGVAAWTTLDKRVLVLEADRTRQQQTDAHQDQLSQSNLSQIRESLREIKQGLDRVSDRLERKP